ncbi:uncharacterized protein [Dysidea avara]|uniref:uncharacterized protein n=1 Tax=Dysidea avara TaxID=196820 RepID=UPI0033301853
MTATVAMLLTRIMLIILSILFIQHVEAGSKGAVVITVSEEDKYIKLSGSGDLSDGSGISQDVISPCCTAGNCTCDSFLHALVSLTDNVMVYITTDVVLSSIVPIVGVENITILGYNNPTVYCNNNGGVKVSSCNNIIVEGIAWKNCGSKNNPVLAMRNSSNITTENCTFQKSRGQAISLVNVKEDAHINRCVFTYNNHHRNHGAAIFFSSQNNQTHLKLHNCNFTDNGNAASIIYINGHDKIRTPLSLLNSEFHNNLGVPIYISHHENVHIRGKALFKDNLATRGGGIISIRSSVVFDENSDVMFKHNSATYGGAIYSIQSVISFDRHSKGTFTNNSAYVGGAIYSDYFSNILLGHYSVVKFTGNNATVKGGAINCGTASAVHVTNSTVSFTENIASGGGGGGGAIHCHSHSGVVFDGNSTVLFTANNATQHGGAIWAQYHSFVSFKGSSMVMFSYNNATEYGGAIHNKYYGETLFEESTTVTFINNTAYKHGGAIKTLRDSTVLFQGSSTVRFIGNNAVLYHGGAVYSAERSDMHFKENCKVEFAENKAGWVGGAIFFYNYNALPRVTVSFEGKSAVMFTNNIAKRAGAMYGRKCDILVTEHSTLTFTENNATQRGGAICTEDDSTAVFNGTSMMTFTSNRATMSGGAIYAAKNLKIVVKGNTHLNFNNNEAGENGGAIYSATNSHIVCKDNSTVQFTNNTALFGGAVHSASDSKVLFKGKSHLTFKNNEASENGGAAYAARNSHIVCEESSLLQFIENAAPFGGAIHSVSDSSIVFTGNTWLTFDKNTAEIGGAVFSNDKCNMTVGRSSEVTFINNSAISSGAMYFHNSDISFVGNSSTMLIGNTATQSGGAVHGVNSDLLLNEAATLTFISNEAVDKGGAIYFTSGSEISFEGHNLSLSPSYFINNTAANGGAVFISGTNMKFGHYSTAIFDGNAALQNGGAVYFSDQCSATFNNYSNITFSNNLAKRYGGALYLKLAQKTVKYSLKASTKFHNNYARIAGYSLYVSVTKSCNINCLNDSISGISTELRQSSQMAATPNKLLFYGILCIDVYNARNYDVYNARNCEIYYTSNIMLGEEITLDACVLDYYNQPSNAARFTVTGEDNPNYQVDGVRDILVSCDAFRGISIIGNKFSSVTSYNYTLTITYFTSEEQSFSIKLIVELSPCHLGFWYDRKLLRCTCYSGDDVVLCSGTTSTIKRGYWFGSVNGQPTAAVCPVNYCDFSCCETTNGFYHLSPLRANQCRSHRSGPACGNCEEGWTLSFDSAECVKTEKCTAGQTTLVVILTVLYWIAVVVAVFVMMYFNVPIGYLYVITYYYGMLDILLNHTLYLSQSLLTTHNTIASIFKITPQFLGQLCLVKGMSGIDQQFIHYVHPLAVTLVLIAISLLARLSYKFSPFISRGFIHVICLLLILSYSSVATTSLLLIRSLTFLDVDKIYSYLSPDIEYFHGRHLPYAIVAVLCTIVIVIGLPLLLLLEPFLKRKLNFTRIKPLLDQFQECYKDRYRYFAAYYMICRLLILILIITTPPNDLTVQYILISICVAMATVHLIVKPYHYKVLNVFDGLILLLVIPVSALPVFNNSNPDSIIGIAFVLALTPLMIFLAMVLLSCKEKIKRFIAYYIPNNTETEDTSSNTEIPMTDVGVIVNENINSNVSDDKNKLVQFQEPSMEAVDKIED